MSTSATMLKRGGALKSKGTRRARWRSVVVLSICVAGGAWAQVNPPLPEPAFTQVRSSSFEYDEATGLLIRETVEPGDPKSCVNTTYSYVDSDNKNYGNRTVVTTANCDGAAAEAVFAARVAKSAYSNVTGQPAGTLPGTYPTVVKNALEHTETKVVDPRFGTVTAVTGPNGLITRWELDEFGRKIKETNPDGTSKRMWYCYVAAAITNKSSNSTGCPGSASPALSAPVAGEMPAQAMSFVQVQTFGKDGTASGPWVREYQDIRARTIRTVTQAFDGGDLATAGKLVVKDTYYNQNGAVVLATQPYFLETGSSTVDGSAHGVSYTQYDVLGRIVKVYTAVADQSKPDLVPYLAMDEYSRRILDNVPGMANLYYSLITTRYDGLKTVVTRKQASGAGSRDLVDTAWRNPLGKVILTEDSASAQTAFVYDASDNLVTTLDPLGNRVDVRYDERGRNKVAMQDPNKGRWTYTYNALGELTSQTSPNQKTANAKTTLTYDVLGRMLTRVNSEFTTNYKYDTLRSGSPCLNASSGSTTEPGTSNAVATLGKLCEVWTSHGVTRTSTVDAKLRLLSQTLEVTPQAGYVQKTLTESFTYDANFGRVDVKTYPTGVATKSKYTTLGYLQAVANANDTSYEFWKATRVNAWSQVEDARTGHGINQRSRFDPFVGRVQISAAGSGADVSDASMGVFKHNYVWDSLNNLQSRVDVHGNGPNSAVSETFAYDELNRLATYSWGSPAFPGETKRVDMAYNAIGNILYKTDVGSYVYPASGQALPHAVASIRPRAGGPSYSADYEYDQQGNLVRAFGDAKYRTLRYNSFNLPQGGAAGAAVVGAPSGATAAPQYDWQYDDAEHRLVEKRVTSRGVRTTWYLHPDAANGLGYEQETDETGVTTHRHYISANGATVAHVTTLAAAPTVFSKVEYWHKDHLGSTAAVTVAGGADFRSVAKVIRYAYDPWGRRRFPSGVPDSSGTPLVGDYHDTSIDATHGTDRGFTGHEHLDDIGVIHMNARLYDPVIARFMQADPVVKEPFDIQTYNSFSYVNNRPLNTVDADGRCPDCFIAALYVVWGLYVSGVIAENDARLLASIVIAAWGGSVMTSELTWANAGIAASSGFASGAVATGDVKGGVQGAFSSLIFWGAGSWADELGKAARSANDMNGAQLWSGRGIGRVALHAAGGCVTAIAGGGDCGRGAMTAGLGKLINAYLPEVGNPLVGAVRAAIVGGTLSTLGGGKFANGAQTGAFQYVFNFWVHRNGELVWEDEENDSCTCKRRRSAQELAASATRRLDKLNDDLFTGLWGLGAGVQYSLRVTVAGTYIDAFNMPVYMNVGDVWKYGETTQIATDLSGGIRQWRYSGASLVEANLEFVPEFVGSQVGAKFMEMVKLKAYIIANGQLPPGNKIPR